MPRILALLLSAALGASPLLADPVELYYFANQKAYRVTEFDGALPRLDVEVDPEESGFDGVRHGAWWAKGELPLKSGSAIQVIDFRLKRLVSAYGNGEAGMRFALTVEWHRLSEVLREVKIKAGASPILVLGWVVDGQLRHVFASGVEGESEDSLEARPLFEVVAEHVRGTPYLWIVDNAGAVAKLTGLAGDAMLFGGGDVDVKALIEAEDPIGRQGIHYAASSGRVELARALLEERKRLVRSRDEKEGTPLRYAVQAGRAEMAALLMEYKAPLSDGWSDLDSIVRLAARLGHTDVVKQLASGKARGGESKWHYSWAASDALNENYGDIAAYLFENGADVAIDEDKKGGLVLGKFAAGHPELGFRLLEKFELPPTLKLGGHTLMHAVAGYADAPLLEKVRRLAGVDAEEGDGGSAIDFAIGSGNVEAICWLIDNGVNTIGPKEAALSFGRAIVSGQLASVDCLIGYGVEVNGEIRPGVTPVMYALLLREFEIARSLYEAGGRCLPDSPHFESTALRIVESDDPELWLGLMGGRLEEFSAFYAGLSLWEVAEFYEADAIKELLSASAEKATGKALRSAGSAEEPPRLASELRVQYPEALRSQYGDIAVRVDLALGADGKPLLVRSLDRELPRELVNLVESGLLAARFEPAKQGGVQVPVTMRARIPLQADFDPKSVYEISEVDTKPAAKQWRDPVYPMELQFRRVRGTVTIEFILLADGTVRDVKPVKYDHKAFAEAAAQSVLQSVWEPATVKGRPVACRVRAPVNFTP